MAGRYRLDVLIPAVALPRVVQTLEEVGNPADAALGQHELQAGWRCNIPEYTKSAVDHIKLVENVAIATAKEAGPRVLGGRRKRTPVR